MTILSTWLHKSETLECLSFCISNPLPKYIFNLNLSTEARWPFKNVNQTTSFTFTLWIKCINDLPWVPIFLVCIRVLQKNRIISKCVCTYIHTHRERERDKEIYFKELAYYGSRQVQNLQGRGCRPRREPALQLGRPPTAEFPLAQGGRQFLLYWSLSLIGRQSVTERPSI